MHGRLSGHNDEVDACKTGVKGEGCGAETETNSGCLHDEERGGKTKWRLTREINYVSQDRDNCHGGRKPASNE